MSKRKELILMRKRIVKTVGENPGIKSRDLWNALGLVPVELWTLADLLIDEGWVIRKVKKGDPVRWYPTNKDLMS